MPEQFEKLKPREKKEEKIEISQEEIKERMERIKSMGRVVGEDFDMGVEIGKKPGWRYVFKPINKIEVDPNDVKEKGLDFCFGVICHEGAHRKISRTDFIPKKIWQERGFSFLMNAVEDPRVNNWVSEKYDGTKEWIEEMYNQSISSEEKVGETAKKKMGYIPKHIRFGLEVIKYWHTGKFSEKLPKEVKKALNKTTKYVKLSYETIPEPKDPTEENIEESAKRSYKINYSAIWPEYKKLVDKAHEDEKLRQMIKEMLENGEIELPKEARGKEKDEKKDKGGEPLPLDELPDDLKEKIKKKIKEKLDSMPEKERKEFEGRAGGKSKKILDELEDEENRKLKGKFSEQPKTKIGEEKDRKEEEEEKKREKELKKTREEIERELEAEKTEYDKVYEKVKPYIDKVADDIINLFITKRWPQFKVSFPGQRLRLKGAMRYEGSKDYRELFERRKRLEKRDYRFLLLVDLSGSMSGDKIERTFEGVVLFAEALNKVAETIGGTKVAIYGFQDNLIDYKKFDKPIDNELREKMSIMKKEVSNDGEHNMASYNNDGYCLDKASKILEESAGEGNFVFVLSDGKPAGDSEHHISGFSEESEDEELHEVIKDISQKGNQFLLGVGLGPEGTTAVDEFYIGQPNVDNLPCKDVEELSEKLANKLEELIK